MYRKNQSFGQVSPMMPYSFGTPASIVHCISKMQCHRNPYYRSALVSVPQRFFLISGRPANPPPPEKKAIDKNRYGASAG